MNIPSDELPVHAIVKAIVEKIQPEKVFLFGSHAGDHDLLVITREGDRRSDYELQAMAGPGDNVSVITHDIGYINERLSEGQYFFSDIQKDGVLLYDAGITPLTAARPLTTAEKKERAGDDWLRWSGNGREFLVDGQNAAGRGSYKKAAFELHQAAECFYNAIILVFRGYKPKTHNLEKLYRYTRHCSDDLATLFPQHTPEEKHLFTLLKKGYVEARYDRKYNINAEEAALLIERVARLQELAAAACADRIASFDTIVE